MPRDMEEKEVTWDNKHSFTKGKFCLTNLVAGYDDVTTVNKGRDTDVICLEFSSIFDTVL